MYSREDIIRGIKQASKEVTDDAQMAGVLTAGANILGISEDEVNALICEDNIEYITIDVVRRIWNDYAVGFEYPDGSDVMCQDSGWTLGAAEQSVGLGRFFVEKPLTGRWSRTANPVDGVMLHAVYRVKDITKVDGGGNREILTRYIPDKEKMERLAEELNKRGLRDFYEAADFALDFCQTYHDFSLWEVKEAEETSLYDLIRCEGCDDEVTFRIHRNKGFCQKIADEINEKQIADLRTIAEIVNAKVGTKSFLDDQCKMVDFFMLSRSEFMNEYQYLTEEEYDATCLDILARSGYENVDIIDPSAMTAREITPIIDAIQKREWLLSRGGEK